jgi:dolichol-phosphate mannosyltransferase
MIVPAKTVILLPTYNEKDNLPKMVAAIKSVAAADILVIDDNSPDGTGLLADSLAKDYTGVYVLHRNKKEGLGRAYVAGYNWALAREYTVIAQMDCDFSHDPKYLPEMLAALSEADVIIGSRYCLGVSCYNWPLRRILLSKFANVYVEVLTKLPVKDATGGFKIFRRQVLGTIGIEMIRSNGYSFQIETTYRAFKQGYRLKEVPIIFYERTRGKSKISRYIIIEAFWLVLKMFLKLYRAPRRLK